MSKGELARLFPVVPGDKRGNRHKLKRITSHLNRRINFFNQEGNQAQEQVAQRGCGLSFMFGGIQTPSGQYPEQPALAGPAQAEELD